MFALRPDALPDHHQPELHRRPRSWRDPLREHDGPPDRGARFGRVPLGREAGRFLSEGRQGFCDPPSATLGAASVGPPGIAARRPLCAFQVDHSHPGVPFAGQPSPATQETGQKTAASKNRSGWREMGGAFALLARSEGLKKFRRDASRPSETPTVAPDARRLCHASAASAPRAVQERALDPLTTDSTASHVSRRRSGRPRADPGESARHAAASLRRRVS